jgi:predicted unusual protein kinase regulating ubiquinone biosynthesis (AarF/ABC1/UbiB family)/cyclopropane fatty-acyl-phospholipid synthase-like methyltransferase
VSSQARRLSSGWARAQRAARTLRAPRVLISHAPGLAYAVFTDRSTLPERVRNALVSLGPAYVKVGQVVSTRVDALPPAWTSELALLRDRMPSEPPEVVTQALRRAFPGGVDSVLCDLSAEPIAAGTVAQVHWARLTTGEPVAVKVLRPGVAEELRAEFGLLLALARAAETVNRTARVLNLRALVLELRDLLLSQTDLTHEARNYRRFARAFADDDTVRIPRVHSHLSSREVLVTEFVHEVDPYDTERVAVDRATMAKRIDDLLDRMIYVTGLCHADLHPGNFFWTADGRIVLVDFGLVHTLSPEERQHLSTFYSAVLDGFAEFAAHYVLRHLTTAGSSPDGGPPSSAALDDLGSVVRVHWTESGGQQAFSRMFVDVLAVLGRHGLQLRHRYSRLFLTLVTVEGYELSLDPDFDPLENARRKRVQLAEYVGIPAAADALILQGFATHSTAMFDGGTDSREAWAARDRFVLDALGVASGTSFLDVGCGRGQLIAEAERRGATALGLTVSEAEYEAGTGRGLDVLLSSWEAADRRPPVADRRFDAIAAVEMDLHLGTLHESREGLLDLRLGRFFGWARAHLRPEGRLFVQTLSVSENLLHDSRQAADLERLIEALPWTGFSTLPQMVRCSDPHFTMEQALDHSTDLLPTLTFWRENVNRQLPALREIVADETIVLIRRHLDTLIGMAESGQLSLYRLLLRARPVPGE